MKMGEASLADERQIMFGLKIVPLTLAREVRDEWKVEACQTRKRRRNWRVVKHHIDRPGAYQIGNTIYMHPDLVAKLKEVTQSERRGFIAARPVD